MKLTVYGCRASMPFFNHKALRYGGNTSSFGLEMDGYTIILDCGTGIMQFHDDIITQNPLPLGEGRGLTLDIFISHLHLDHIIGLSMFDFLFDETNKIRIFTRSRADLPLVSQVFGIFKPPYWPIDIAEMSKASVHEITGGEVFNLNPAIKVSVFDSMHDNDTTGFRFEGEKTVVYLLDYELNDGTEMMHDLVDFCKNADVIVFDATYLPEDYPPRRGWGHSTYEPGMVLAEKSNCKRMVFSHFFHIYSDQALDALSKKLQNERIEYHIAYDGMVLTI